MTFRSQFEEIVSNALGPEWAYEPCKVAYHVPKTYTPDFVRGKTYIECKGYFRMGDTQKYKAIHKQLESEGKQLVFILMDPYKKVNRGRPGTMAQWCERNGIPWYDLETLEDNLDAYA